jgi:UDP-N-acetylglucosamine 1-carboxyvinyltransferase
MESVLACAEQMGAELIQDMDGLLVKMDQRPIPMDRLTTGCYPAFPTDLQSLFMVVMALSDGQGCIRETVFENRFRIVPELCRMGASIEIHGNQAYVTGTASLHGAIVQAQELRGGAALVAAALAAEGTSIVTNRHYIDRGYEDIVMSFRELGADIELA